jgi:hypothetical protein
VRTNPSSSSVSSSRRAVGRARPAAVATSDKDMVRWSASKPASTSSPRASDSTKSGPAPRPAIVPLPPCRPANWSVRAYDPGSPKMVPRASRVESDLYSVYWYGLSSTSPFGSSGFIPLAQASSPSDERR